MYPALLWRHRTGITKQSCGWTGWIGPRCSEKEWVAWSSKSDSSADLRFTGAFGGTGTCQQSGMNIHHARCFGEQVGGLEGGMS